MVPASCAPRCFQTSSLINSQSQSKASQGQSQIKCIWRVKRKWISGHHLSKLGELRLSEYFCPWRRQPSLRCLGSRSRPVPPRQPWGACLPLGHYEMLPGNWKGVPRLPPTPQLPLAPSLLLELLPAAAAAQHGGGGASTNQGAVVWSSLESPQAGQRDEATATKLGRFPFLSLDHDFVALIHVPR